MQSAKGKAFAQTGRCLTDKFTISNQVTIPEICGTVTGEHGKYKLQKLTFGLKL